MKSLLLAVALPVCGATLANVQVADVFSAPVTASATYWTDSTGTPEMITASDFPTESLAISIPAEHGVTVFSALLVSLSLRQLTSQGAGGDWDFTATVTSGPFTAVIVDDQFNACSPPCVGVPYDGSATTVNVTWQPLFDVNFDDPAPAVDGPFFTGGSFDFEASATINGLAVPEPSTFVPLVFICLVYLGLLWRNWRSA